MCRGRVKADISPGSGCCTRWRGLSFSCEVGSLSPQGSLSPACTHYSGNISASLRGRFGTAQRTYGSPPHTGRMICAPTLGQPGAWRPCLPQHESPPPMRAPHPRDSMPLSQRPGQGRRPAGDHRVESFLFLFCGWYTRWLYMVVVHDGCTRWLYTVVAHGGCTQWLHMVVIHGGHAYCHLSRPIQCKGQYTGQYTDGAPDAWRCSPRVTTQCIKYRAPDVWQCSPATILTSFLKFVMLTLVGTPG